MSAFEAKYSGYCYGGCGERIEAGEWAKYGDEGLMHVDCTPEPDRPVTVCQSCWLIQPCDCEEAK